MGGAAQYRLGGLQPQQPPPSRSAPGFAVRVRDPACIYKLAMIANVATVVYGLYIGHTGARVRLVQ